MDIKNKKNTKPSHPTRKVEMKLKKNFDMNKQNLNKASPKKKSPTPSSPSKPKMATTINKASTIEVAPQSGDMKRWACGTWANSPDPKDLPMPSFEDEDIAAVSNRGTTSMSTSKRVLATARVDWSTAFLLA